MLKRSNLPRGILVSIIVIITIPPVVNAGSVIMDDSCNGVTGKTSMGTPCIPRGGGYAPSPLPNGGNQMGGDYGKGFSDGYAQGYNEALKACGGGNSSGPVGGVSSYTPTSGSVTSPQGCHNLTKYISATVSHPKSKWSCNDEMVAFLTNNSSTKVICHLKFEKGGVLEKGGGFSFSIAPGKTYGGSSQGLYSCGHYDSDNIRFYCIAASDPTNCMPNF